MALSFVYRIPMLKSTVQTLNLKYHQVKSGNIFLNLILSTIELCFYLCVQLWCTIQTYDYKKYWAQVNHYLHVFVYQYATPVLWLQLTDIFYGIVHFTMEAGSASVKYVEHMLCSFRGFESPHTTVNFDSPNMNTLIDLITRSLAELKLKENSSMLELGGYENEFHQPGVIVEHSSTSCHCDKHHEHDEPHVYTNNNNNNVKTITSKEDMEVASVASSSSADDNIIAVSYGKQEKNPTKDQLPSDSEDNIGEQTSSGQEWHKLYPSSQPLIPMMSADKAFKLAEALKEKRQDKTGRDAYEVDTVLVLLSQWDVIDEKSKHYAIDRANLLFLAICYGWSFALQKISPTTSAPIVTPPVTNPAPSTTREHVPLQRQHSNEGIAPQAKRFRKNVSRSHGSLFINDVISRSHNSVYSNDIGKHQPYNRYFHRSNEYNNNYRQSFPPNRYHHNNHFNSNHFYPE